MNTEIQIFYPSLQQITGCHVVRAEGATVGECLDDLVKQYPGAASWIFDGNAQLHDYVYAYINADSARKARLSEKVKQGDRLILALMVNGG